MKIKKVTSRSRRDFWAVYKCEHCDAEKATHGYDDANFHDNVIPKMKCHDCGKISPENYEPIATKYEESVVI